MKTPAKLLREAIEAARQKVAPPQPVPNHDIAVLRRDQSGKVIGLKTPEGDDVDVVLVEKNLTGGVTKIAKLTQAQYDALAVKDDSTLYIIVAG